MFIKSRKKSMLIIFILSTLISIPTMTLANFTPHNKPHLSHVNKATFLSAVRETLIPSFYQRINKNKILHKLFQKHNINKLTFAKQIRPLLNQCINKFRKQIPTQVNAFDVIIWNHEIFSCTRDQYGALYIDNDFKKAISKSRFVKLFKQKIINQYFKNIKKNMILKNWLYNQNLNKERFNYAVHPMMLRCIANNQSKIPARLTLAKTDYWNKKLLHCLNQLMINYVNNQS